VERAKSLHDPTCLFHRAPLGMALWMPVRFYWLVFERRDPTTSGYYFLGADIQILTRVARLPF